jgi:ribosomal protein S18 acetylase RimI-like enzyme
MLLARPESAAAAADTFSAIRRGTGARERPVLRWEADIALIRLLGDGDVEIFRSIRLEALRTEPGSFASTAADWENLPDDEWRRRLTDNPVFVAFVDHQPAGIMGLMRQQASKMHHRASLVMVYVRWDARGTGLARAILAQVEDHARAHGIRQIELSVSVENHAAIRFYRREGFAEIGCIPGGFLHEGREIDDLLMAKRV